MNVGAFTLNEPATADDWAAYHAIRRAELFPAGSGVVYDSEHPDERTPGRRPLLLRDACGVAAGTARLDDGPEAESGVLRLVAVVRSRQGSGLGRILAALVERRAVALGMRSLYVNAAPEAVGFYRKLGFQPYAFDPAELTGIAENCIQMRKTTTGDA